MSRHFAGFDSNGAMSAKCVLSTPGGYPNGAMVAHRKKL
jgi:hypothetical protein